MYPLNMHHKAAGGYALANDEAEHKALSDAGYEPKLEEAAPGDSEIEQVRAQLDAAGIKYHHKAGLDKLKELLPKE